MPQLTQIPALQRLDALVGEWELENPQYPEVRGRATFEWLEGGAFLVQHSEVDHAAVPNATMIIGRDESTETYCILYYDSRGVSRVYQMSLFDGVWKMCREAPASCSASRAHSATTAKPSQAAGRDRATARIGNTTLT